MTLTRPQFHPRGVLGSLSPASRGGEGWGEGQDAGKGPSHPYPLPPQAGGEGIKKRPSGETGDGSVHDEVDVWALACV